MKNSENGDSQVMVVDCAASNLIISIVSAVVFVYVVRIVVTGILS